MAMYTGCLEGDKLNFIAVDCFTKAVVNSASAFFLSHYHTDHFCGLRKIDNSRTEVSNIFKANPNKILYCSHITRRLFINDDSSRIPEEQIVGVSPGESIIVTGPEEDGKVPVTVSVTLLPSGHILGAVMFLFEHENERALFTGDFRIYPGDIPKLKPLHFENGDVKPITHLYLDTTFGYTDYPSFPLRSEVSSELVKMISEWFSLNNVVHIELPYKFAYEKLLIDLSKGLKCKIAVDGDAYNSCYVHIPELDDAVFPVPNDIFEYFYIEKFKIHAFVGPGRRENCTFCSRYKPHKVKVIRPCAQAFKKNVLEKGYTSCSLYQETTIVRVAYSSHCSFEELKAFVEYLKPKEMFSIVSHTSELALYDIKKHLFSLAEKSVDKKSPELRYFKKYRLL